MSFAILNGGPRHIQRVKRASAFVLDYSRSVLSGAATQPQSSASKHKHNASLNAHLCSDGVMTAVTVERQCNDSILFIRWNCNVSAVRICVAHTCGYVNYYFFLLCQLLAIDRK